MEPLRTIKSRTVVLARENIDTDQIIPARFLKTTEKKGLGKALFSDWRYGPDGAPKPDFVLNRPEYAGATVLVAGPDFGTGSSREHAVWALQDYGFRVVLSPRFADIFRGNSGKQGLLTGVVSQADVERLWAALETSPGAEVTVDLEARTASLGDLSAPFDVDDYTRWRLMEGLDDIGLTLRHVEEITAYEQRRPSWLPTTLPAR